MAREGFHAHHGWYWRRNDDGSVTVEVAESSHPEAPLKVATTLSPSTWASIVAAVSAGGENGANFRAAERLHSGVVS